MGTDRTWRMTIKVTRTFLHWDFRMFIFGYPFILIVLQIQHLRKICLCQNSEKSWITHLIWSLECTLFTPFVRSNPDTHSTGTSGTDISHRVLIEENNSTIWDPSNNGLDSKVFSDLKRKRKQQEFKELKNYNFWMSLHFLSFVLCTPG